MFGVIILTQGVTMQFTKKTKTKTKLHFLETMAILGRVTLRNEQRDVKTFYAHLANPEYIEKKNIHSELALEEQKCPTRLHAKQYLLLERQEKNSNQRIVNETPQQNHPQTSRRH